MCELGQGAGPDTDAGSSNEGQQQVAGGCLYSILDASVHTGRISCHVHVLRTVPLVR
jgi:hypothetical protein